MHTDDCGKGVEDAIEVLPVGGNRDEVSGGDDAATY